MNEDDIKRIKRPHTIIKVERQKKEKNERERK